MTNHKKPSQPRPILPGDSRGSNPDNPARSQIGYKRPPPSPAPPPPLRPKV